MRETNPVREKEVNMRIPNVDIEATALGYYTSEGIVGDLCAAGLVIGDDYIEFPDSILDSVTWMIGWRHELCDPNDQHDEREYWALDYVLRGLYRRGGKQNLAPEYNS
jgi:hypothetical protein